ncbi:hypothetical protein PIB30_077385 [Stylosanthes scabra]|uniref:Uncharacterized protein n=1 Tax=Stylosanthes scabra TaxID=79078 RepID=A0ABU6VPP2_9FABA|nr:hypothetical protein [Stylosanthes scabra]
MARKGSSPLAKGKGKARGLPTRASPRLVALRSQAAAQNQLGTPVTPAINTPTLSLPIKKRPLNKAAGEGTPKAAAKYFRRRYLRIATISRTFMQAPKEQGVNAISSDPKLEPAPKDANRETAKMDGDEEEDLKEEPKKVPNVEDEAKLEEAGNGPGEHLHGEYDPVTHFANEISESIDLLANNDHLWNYGGNLGNCQNAELAVSSIGSCTGLPPAEN